MTIKLDEIVVVLEAEIKEQDLVIEKARRDIEAAQGRIKWATRVIRWLRSGSDPERTERPVERPIQLHDGPRVDTANLHACPYCTFVAATPRGLKHHETVKHPREPFVCATHSDEGRA